MLCRANEWSDPVDIVDHEGHGKDFLISTYLDPSNGNMHYLYIINDYSFLEYLVKTMGSDGTISKPISLFEENYYPDNTEESGMIAGAGNGKDIYVVAIYTMYYVKKILFSESSDNGKTWSAPIVPVGPKDRQNRILPRLVVSPSSEKISIYFVNTEYGVSFVTRESRSGSWSPEIHLPVKQCRETTYLNHLYAYMIPQKNTEEKTVVAFRCGNNERIEMMESTDLTHWNEFSSSEVTYSGTTLFPMQIDPASKRIFFANRIEDGHYLESTVFEYRFGGSFVKKGTFIHKNFVWQRIGLFNRGEKLHLLRLTSNKTNFGKDRFFELEVDSPSNIQNLPYPTLNPDSHHFQFNYYKDEVILTVNINNWLIRQYKMKA